MSLLALPNELIAQILRFTQIDTKREFVKLRLVCRTCLATAITLPSPPPPPLMLRIGQFDDHASRVIIENSSVRELDIGRKLHWRPSIEWMLATKVRIETCKQGVFAFVHDATEHLVDNMKGAIPQLALDTAVVAACCLIVAANGPSRVVKHLVTWKAGNHPLPRPLSSLENYTRGQKVQDPEVFFGMLHLLVACGDEVAVELIMKKRANIDAVDSVATHPVFGDLMGCAIVLDRVAVIRTLLLHGLDPRIVTVEGKRPGTLVYAAEMNREAAVRAIVGLSTSININARGRFSHTVLGWAARKGWTDIVRLLLQRGDIDSNLANHLFETPLAAAAKEDHEDIARLLLERVAIDPSQLGLSKDCPWWVALTRQEPGVCCRENARPKALLPKSGACEHVGLPKILLAFESVPWLNREIRQAGRSMP